MEDDDSDELTAYHEAGHVVMALLTGARVPHVTISPDRDDGPARFGDTSVLWPSDQYGQRELAQAMIRVFARRARRRDDLHGRSLPSRHDGAMGRGLAQRLGSGLRAGG